MGMYNKKEKSNAVSLFKFLSMPPTIVEPLLEIPGTSAITWNNPIMIASFRVMCLLSFFPFMFLIRNRNPAVIRRVTPTNLIFFSRISNIPSFVTISPVIPAGMVAVISNKQYLIFFDVFYKINK